MKMFTQEKTFVTFPQKGLPSSLPSLPALRQEITEARQALEAMEPKVRQAKSEKAKMWRIQVSWEPTGMSQEVSKWLVSGI